MRCAARARKDDFQPAICRAFGIVIKPFRGAVCGHDLAFMRNIQRRLCFGGMRRGVPIGTAAHYDADQRLSLRHVARAEEHTSELQSIMRMSYAVFWLTTTQISNSDDRKQNK